MTSLARVWADAFRNRGPETAFEQSLAASSAFRPIETATQTVALSGTVIKLAAAHPRAWMRESVIESSRALRVVTIPLLLASLAYILTYASVVLGKVVYTLGAGDRLPSAFPIGLMREVATWISFMVLAGIVASALAGDLGARRIRGEIDALDVLGVDKMRALVVPRVIALTFLGLTLPLLVVLVNLICGLLTNQMIVHLDFETQVQAAKLNLTTYDLVAGMLKHAVLGFVIGIVACQKGLSARGGAEGVGRAVNETVVITFFAIWLINSLFNTVYLTLVPDVLGLKG